MLLNDESPELRSRASLSQRCCSSETANVNVLTWWQDSGFTKLGKDALGVEVAKRDTQSLTLHKSQEPQGSAKLWAPSQRWESGVEPGHLPVNYFHSVFLDVIINNAPDQRNLLVVARELCACHCRIKSTSSRQKYTMCS